MVDVFTKYTEVIPLKDKPEGSLLSGLMEGFNKMGHKPQTVYSDDEWDYHLNRRSNFSRT